VSKTNWTSVHLWLVLGRSSKHNRRLNILAAIDRNRNRDIRKGKCDFDCTLFRCCTICLVRYQNQATSPVRIVQRSRRSMERVDNPGRVREGRRPDGHNGVISITGSAISPASVHALTLDSDTESATVNWVWSPLETATFAAKIDRNRSFLKVTIDPTLSMTTNYYSQSCS